MIVFFLFVLSISRLLIKFLVLFEILLKIGLLKFYFVSWMFVRVLVLVFFINGDKLFSRIYVMILMDYKFVVGVICLYVMIFGVINFGVLNIILRFFFGLYFFVRLKLISLICLLFGLISMMFLGLRFKWRIFCWCKCWIFFIICFM